MFNYFTDVVGTGTRTCSHREGDLFGIEVRKQSDVPARPGFIGRLAAASALFCLSPALPAAIQFTDVTAGSGTAYTGESYGSSWGDFNSDGLPDLFVSHHRAPPGLYINLGDGTFEDRSFAVDVWQSLPNADQHGAAWSDFDNDGDNDLFVTAGAKNGSQFLVNDGTFLSFATDQYTFDVKAWGGRMPVWFDFAGDGLLDFAIAVQGQTFHLHEQRAGDLVKVNQVYGNNCTDNDYGQLADVTRDGILDLICIAQQAFPQRIYDITARPFSDRTPLIPQTPNNIDSAFADFDGDLVSDALVVRGQARVNGAEITGSNAIEAHIIDNGINQTGFSFATGGTVTFELHWSARNVGNIFIGASGTHPGPADANGVITFTLSPSDPDVAGLRPLDSNPGQDSLFVGFDPNTQRWQFWSVSNKWNYTYTYVDSTQPVSNLSLQNLKALDMPRPPTLYLSSSGSYVDRTSFAGLSPALPCVSVAAADFDNDMDVDLFFVCRNAVSNAPDRLYENQGNGTFTQISSAGGAQGPVGSGVGLGENVTAADYDVDGFVDLFVNNGLALFPEMPLSNGGPDKLYKNRGNANHWIQLELIGTTSNRDGVGARVVATAGGVSQLREQNGGYHRWAQHHPRIHFGLGSRTVVDLEVRWPSGAVDSHPNVPADKLYAVTENGTIEEIDLPTDVDPSPCGSAGGMPLYSPGFDQGI
ncbi:MAG: CRTAC1 family protein, partial [Gammaproteobacteria bacterium]|nr:CRTAC1 family protein [Gammaproteobacteria bacterium]